MKMLGRKITTAAALLALAAGVSGCSLFPSPPPPLPPSPTSLVDANCPFLDEEEIVPVRIPLGTPKEAIGGVLNTYSAWLNAGSETMTSWASRGSVTEKCVAQLAARNAEAYAATVFTSHSDVAWQQYFGTVEAMNARNLWSVAKAEPGQGGRGTFELLQEIDSSATDNGTFLKFDAVYRPRPASRTADGGSWEGWETPTRWYVELVPAGDFLVINYIEQTPLPTQP
ncbi:hypothetical protein M1D88_17980 [Arthrobacter sp. R1-13]